MPLGDEEDIWGAQAQACVPSHHRDGQGPVSLATPTAIRLNQLHL